jgi:hypothetical protein
MEPKQPVAEGYDRLYRVYEQWGGGHAGVDVIRARGVGGGSLRRFIVNIALDACIFCTGRWRIDRRIAHPGERGDEQ